MAQVRSFPIPETRLPFVNAEFAKIERAGKTWLVTSIWGGTGNGQIVLIDPWSGDCEMRRLPEGEPGAYMLQTGPDGRLYLGGGEGNLFRYDPREDAMETLVTGQMPGIAWGGCVTARHVVWTASPGDACVYDWRAGRLRHVLRPVDPETPNARYGHRVLECPDGQILLAMDVPQARLVLLDPECGARRAVMPEALLGKGGTGDATFLDPQTLAFFCGAELLLYRFPSFEPLGRVAAPEGVRIGGHACLCGRRFYALGTPPGILYRLQTDRSGWEVFRRDWPGEEHEILVALDERTLCAVSPMGNFLRLDLERGEIFSRPLDAWGPLGVHAFRPIPEIGKGFGAPFINQRFWMVDLLSGQGAELGRAAPGTGQINALVWEPQTRRVLLASYTTCSVTAFDPERPPSWPENPRLLARIGEEQMRPKALVHDGRHVWMTSSAHYGHLGGALSRIDPLDGSTRVWRHLVQDQTPNTLVSDPARRRLYASTEIHADCDSAPPTQRTGRLVSFDLDALRIANECAPFEDAPKLRLLALLPKGRVLGVALRQGAVPAERKTKCVLFLWNPETGSCEEIGAAPQGLREAALAPDGSLYTSVQGQVGRLHVEDGGARFEPLVPGEGRFLSFAANRLWYVVGQEIRVLT